MRPSKTARKKRNFFIAQDERRKAEFRSMRDNNLCEWCASNKNLTIDHITPKSQGGGDDKYNLRVLCKNCHKERHRRKRW